MPNLPLNCILMHEETSTIITLIGWVFIWIRKSKQHYVKFIQNSKHTFKQERKSCILSFNNHVFWKNNEYSMEKGWNTWCNRTGNTHTHTHTHGESGSQSGRRELSQNLSRRQNCPIELGHNDQHLYTYTHSHTHTHTHYETLSCFTDFTICAHCKTIIHLSIITIICEHFSLISTCTKTHNPFSYDQYNLIHEQTTLLNLSKKLTNLQITGSNQIGCLHGM